ncbi:serine O-acetyltransferase EpsC [Acidovorax sp. NCPPB 4044]|uniref:serine O-acetyltransferase EpsC n=1 Tax=Acidovorax sp. NCPPB 4044 TaxID=2940490 RepID=UPI002304BF7E|nr:serine O-acetyltransferase EpsC [Acidovorax sp. NCPPB 4044]MDA8521162.1 serine acetyltransferase [Acidovorax sp. NCPPB 4044]
MATFDIAGIGQRLHAVRREWREAQNREQEPAGREFPSRDAVARIVEQLKGALFPLRLGPHDLRPESEDLFVAHQLDAALQTLHGQIALELGHGTRHAGAAAEAEDREAAALSAARAFAEALPDIRRLLDSDVLAAYRGDPAARSVDEVLLCYPGVLAMIHHRLAHILYGLGLALLARMVSELAHAQTGIDIHPGARIGAGFFIDHGTGVVIGETAVIGERVRLYQAVTLGAKRFPTDAEGRPQKGLARHPRVEDDVVIYAGATILGRVTLGRGAVIGGNVWVTHDVPAGAHITQATARENGRESARESAPSQEPAGRAGA